MHYVYYHRTKQKGPCSQKSVRVEALESQIGRTLARFTIGEKYVGWALETLARQAKDDGVAAAQIGRNLKREQTKLKQELAELNRFIIKQESAGRILRSKEEALAEKQRLIAQLKGLDPGQAENHEVGDGLDETAGALDYACHARFWLKEGTPEQKREVFTALGSNLTLKDKKARFDLTYPLPEIERMIEIAPQIISTFEPREMVGTWK